MSGGQLILDGGGVAIGPNGGRVILGDAPCGCCGPAGDCVVCGFVGGQIPTQAVITVSGVAACDGCRLLTMPGLPAGRGLVTNGSPNGTYVITQFRHLQFPELPPIGQGTAPTCARTDAPHPSQPNVTHHVGPFVDDACTQLDPFNGTDTTCQRMRCNMVFGVELGQVIIRVLVSPAGCVGTNGVDRYFGHVFEANYTVAHGDCLSLGVVYQLATRGTTCEPGPDPNNPYSENYIGGTTTVVFT